MKSVARSKKGRRPAAAVRKRSPAAAQWLNLAEGQYVVVPAADYLQLRLKAGEISAQDLGDIAEARRILAEPAEKPVPYEQVRRQLKLA